MSNDLVAIDISHHQPDPDFAEIRAAGIVGVLLKATEGTSYIDETFAQRRADADIAGLKTASYHFLKHGNVINQMNHYLDTVAPVPGERVVIDYEDEDCTIGDLTQAVEYLLSAPIGLQLTVYGASKLTEDAAGHGAQLAGTSLWAARYSSMPPVIATDVWPLWSLWQFTDKASVPGIAGAVDGNRFNGSAEACAAWFGPAVEPVPVPEDDVFVDITVKPGISVSVWINGQPWDAAAR